VPTLLRALLVAQTASKVTQSRTTFYLVDVIDVGRGARRRHLIARSGWWS